jgi:isoleucyl-tRNA synthetase
MSFNENDLKMQVREVLIPLWNIYKYLVTYANLHNFQPNAAISEDPTDKWMLALLNKSVGEIDDHFASYEIPATIREIVNLINETSKWYIRSNRARFADGDHNALQTLYTAVTTIAKLAAPIIPFTTEHIYREVELAFDKSAPQSVHLVDFPTFDANMDLQILSEMDLVRAVCDLGQSIRTNNGLKVRQPLATLEIKLANNVTLSGWMQDIIKSELNVKAVKLVADLTLTDGWFSAENNGTAIAMDSNLTAELKYEGLVREVIRAVQAERKRIGTEIEDQIILTLHADQSAELEFVQSSDQLRSAIKATEVNPSTTALETKVKGTGFSIAVAKA